MGTSVTSSAGAELLALAREADPELRGEGLLSLASRQERPETAAEIYAELLSIPGLPSTIQERARRRWNALRGEGEIGDRAEILLSRFSREATDPTALLAMSAAGLAFRATRFLTLSRLVSQSSGSLFSRGLGARAISGLAAFGVEATVFPLAARAGNLASGRELDWSAPVLGREIASSFLMLGALRAGGLLSGTLAGPSALRRSLAQQAGMFGGIVLGHELEVGAGLRQQSSGAVTLIDSLSTLLQFNVAGRLNRSLLGPRMESWERRVDAQSAALEQRPSKLPIFIPVAVAAGPAPRFAAEPAPQESRSHILQMSGLPKDAPAGGSASGTGKSFAISPRVERIEIPGPTLVSGWIAAAQAEGREVTNLGMGQNGFDPSALVLRETISKLETESAGYSSPRGTPALIQAIQARYQREHGVAYRPEQIVVGGGGKYSAHTFCATMLKPGDWALIVGPGWPGYRPLIEDAGAEARYLLTRPERGYKVSAAELEAAVASGIAERGSRPAAVFLTNPGNPGGGVYTRTQLEKIGNVVQREGLLVFADEIYSYFGKNHVHLASLPGMSEQVVTMDGATKNFGRLAGIRATYLLGPQYIVDAILKFQVATSAHAAVWSQHALTAALNGNPQEAIRPQIQEFERRTRYAAERLNNMGIVTPKPAATFYLFADGSSLIGKTYVDRHGQTRVIETDLDLVRAFLGEADVGVVHGSSFYFPNNQGFFRVSTGGADLAALEKAMDRLELFVNRLRASDSGTAR